MESLQTDVVLWETSEFRCTWAYKYPAEDWKRFCCRETIAKEKNKSITTHSVSPLGWIANAW